VLYGIGVGFYKHIENCHDLIQTPKRFNSISACSCYTGCPESSFADVILKFQRKCTLFTACQQQEVRKRRYNNCSTSFPPFSILI
jgi:uncharacterized protein (DUF1919 family)